MWQARKRDSHILWCGNSGQWREILLDPCAKSEVWREMWREKEASSLGLGREIGAKVARVMARKSASERVISGNGRPVDLARGPGEFAAPRLRGRRPSGRGMAPLAAPCGQCFAARPRLFLRPVAGFARTSGLRAAPRHPPLRASGGLRSLRSLRPPPPAGPLRVRSGAGLARGRARPPAGRPDFGGRVGAAAGHAERAADLGAPPRRRPQGPRPAHLFSGQPAGGAGSP